MIADRTATALKAKQARGEHVGAAPRGTRIESKRLVADADGLKLYRRASELREQGLTYQEVADALMAEGFVAQRGRRLWPSTVYAIVNNQSLKRLASAAA
jgi:hypothetical protein